MPNLRGASPVGRDEGGRSYAARADSREETSRRRGDSGKSTGDGGVVMSTRWTIARTVA